MKERTLESDRRGARKEGANYWVISGGVSPEDGVLVLHHNGREILPVFSFEDEARMYALYGARGMGEKWSVLSRSAGEVCELLVSGKGRGAGHVALDPIPEFREDPDSLALTLVRRGAFLECFCE